jgi:NAD-dependent dihydropyrimidine dehydrogenase PreA subunit
MPFIITDPCIETKDTACVDVCPVDCIHPRKDEAEFAQATMLLYPKNASTRRVRPGMPGCGDLKTSARRRQPEGSRRANAIYHNGDAKHDNRPRIDKRTSPACRADGDPAAERQAAPLNLTPLHTQLGWISDCRRRFQCNQSEI